MAPPRTSDQLVKDVWELRQNGWTLRQIGDKYGFTSQWASSLQSRHPQYQPVRMAAERIVRAAEMGELDPTLLAERYGVSRGHVMQVMRDAGFKPERPAKLPTAVNGRLPADDHRHGRPHGYSAGCRCEPCVESNRQRNLHGKFARLEDGLPLDDPRHGTENGYSNWNCRCDPCRVAGSERNRRRRAARGTGGGTLQPPPDVTCRDA